MTSSEREILLLNNQDVEKILTIKDTIRALDDVYLELEKASPRIARGRLLHVQRTWAVSSPTPTKE